jgi:hypothetical protein
MDKDKFENKIKSTLNKILWLHDIVENCIAMDKYHGTQTGTNVHMQRCFVEDVEHDIRMGKFPSRKDLTRCNAILKEMKALYRFDTDWRGNIVKCDRYTDYDLNRQR